MRHDVRHRLAEDRVDEEDRADDDEGNADCAAGGVEQEQDTDPAEDRLDRNAVPDVEHPLARHETAPAEEEIERGARGEEGKGDVVDRQAVRAPAAREGIDEEAEEEGEGEVDPPRGNIADDGEVQHEGERGCDPELIDRPCEAEQTDQHGEPRALPPAAVLDLLRIAVGAG